MYRGSWSSTSIIVHSAGDARVFRCGRPTGSCAVPISVLNVLPYCLESYLPSLALAYTLSCSLGPGRSQGTPQRGYDKRYGANGSILPTGEGRAARAPWPGGNAPGNESDR